MKDILIGIGIGIISILLGGLLSISIKFPFESMLVIVGMLQVLLGGCNLIAHLGNKYDESPKGVKQYTRNMKLMSVVTLMGIGTIVLSIL